MIAVGAVFVLLYGMVAFGVVTSLNHRPEPAHVALNAPAFAPIAPEVPKPAEDAKKTPDPAPKNPDEHKSDTKAIPNDKKEEKPQGDQNKEKPEKEKPGTTDVANADAKNPSDNNAKTSGKLLASVTQPAPTLTPTKAEGPKPETWGLLRGLPGDCQIHADAAGLTVNIPGTLHVVSPDLKLYNAPQLLTEAGGDFTAVVKVVGRISPGNVPLDFPLPAGEKPQDPNQVPKFPFTFQGAGLLVWQDQTNFIQLERSARFIFESGKRIPMVLLEQIQNGQLVNGKEIPAKDKETAAKDGRSQGKEREIDLTLRVIRIGSEFRCSYSPDDGKTWLEVKRLQAPTMPPTVKVGVTAVNVSAKPYAAHFQGFDLSANTK